MLIDLTYACSMGCTHCMSDCKPDGQHMSIKVLKDSLDFMIKYNIPLWSFSGGEMFEHPDILEILDIIEEKWNKNYPIAFITNGRKLVNDRDIYDRVSELVKKYSKKKVFIQVTDDERFYPTKLSQKERYWLEKIVSYIDTVPGDKDDRNKCLYPQGRALENFPDAKWNTIAPKCVNVRLLTIQEINSIHDLVMTLISRGKICTPVIAPDGSIKLGESALCPAVATIYDNEEDIINSIMNCKCKQCKIPWDIMKQTNPLAYELLGGE